MVQADGRDQGQLRRQDIRGIQPTAEARLNDRDIHTGVRKPLEGKAGRDLEKGKILLLEIRLPGTQKVENVFFGNQFVRRLGKAGAFLRVASRPYPGKCSGKPPPSRN